MSYSLTVDSSIVNLLTRKLAHHYRLAAIGMEEGRVILATDTSDTLSLYEELEVSLNFNFKLQEIPTSELNTLLQKYYFEDSLNVHQEKSTSPLQFNPNYAIGFEILL